MINKTLITLSSLGKVRVIELDLEFEDDIYLIKRRSYQFKGKIVEQPTVEVTEGKVNRTLEEQANLEYNSHLNKYLDKGYKELDGDINSYTEEELLELLPEKKTDAKGIVKPMLAKDIHTMKESSINKEIWYGSRKINGVRCLMYLNDEGVVETSSRGGKHYNISCKAIMEDIAIVRFLNENPDVILDGELYIPGKSLQYISGIVRRDKPSNELQYWIYDLAIDDIAANRLKFLFDNIKNLKSPHIKILPHVIINNMKEAKKLHDRYVNEGYEGVVLRNAKSPYGFGKRNAAMVKLKEYKELEATIVAFEFGLRGVEDMVFVMQLGDEIEFKAKPIGSLEVKQEYINNIENIIGKQGTIKFFEFSETGVPQQPIFQTVRDYE